MITTRWDITIAFAGLMSAALFGLSACDMYAETNFAPQKMQARQEKFTDDKPVSEITSAYVRTIAEGYSQSGNGPLDITVTYDPHSKTNTAMKAGAEAARLSKAFRGAGIADAHAGVLPINEQGPESEVLLSYDAYKLSPPKGCEKLMPGMNDNDTTPDPDYKLGCTMDTVMAKEIRPKDAAGRTAGDTSSDGRRDANVVETYRTGTPNKPLSGMNASSTGSGG